MNSYNHTARELHISAGISNERFAEITKIMGGASGVLYKTESVFLQSLSANEQLNLDEKIFLAFAAGITRGSERRCE